MKLAVVVAMLCAVSAASADDKIDALFKKGKQQLDQKKYDEACATFEEVDKLEPGIGAKLNVARCYEDWGKLAIAYRWYDDALKMAIETKDKRTAKIKELIEALDSDVPRLTIKLPAKIDPTAAAVKLNGKVYSIDLLGKEQRVDPGQHVIDYRSGKIAKNKTLKLERGGSTEVELVFDANALAKPDTNPDVTPGSPRNTRKLVGIISGATGIAALGVAGVLTLTARSNYKDALTDQCMGETNLCNAQGLKFTNNAKQRANVATVVSIVGVVAVGAGVVLYLTAPKSKAKTNTEKRVVYVAPSAVEHGAAVILGGRF